MRMKLINRWQSSSLSLNAHACGYNFVRASRAQTINGPIALCVANCSGIIMSVTKSYYCNRLWSLRNFSFISICLVAAAVATTAAVANSSALVIVSFEKNVFFFLLPCFFSSGSSNL